MSFSSKEIASRLFLIAGLVFTSNPSHITQEQARTNEIVAFLNSDPDLWYERSTQEMIMSIGSSYTRLSDKEKLELSLKLNSTMITADQAICQESTEENLEKTTGSLNWPLEEQILILQYYQGRWHPGIDIVPADLSNSSALIRAADGGTVAKTTRSTWGFGNQLIINHGRGRTTVYSHLADFLISPGAEVEKGQVIGVMGSTGRSTGLHLDFMVMEKRGGSCQLVNPLSRLPQSMDFAP